MIQHVWSVLCRQGIIDQRTNSVSLVEVIEGISIAADSNDLPTDRVGFLPFEMDLVSLWTRSTPSEGESGLVRATISGPHGLKIQHAPMELDLTESISRRHLIHFSAIPSRGVGRYTIGVQVERSSAERTRWVTVARIPYNIRIQPAPSESEPEDKSAPAGERQRAAASKQSRRRGPVRGATHAVGASEANI